MALLALPGFLFNLQPGEPFLTRFLEEARNVSGPVLAARVWPADVYASLALALPAGAAAEGLGYGPAALAGLLLREATRALLLFGRGPTAMVWMQVAYAGGTAMNAVYFSLPYVLLGKMDARFAVATAVQHAAYHGGNIVGAAIGQGLVSSGTVTDLTVLFYISWGMTTLGLLALILLLVLVPVKAPPISIYRSIRANGLRNLVSLDLMTVGACTGLCFMSAQWSILGNYFQQNLKESHLAKADYGYVELGIEVVFVLAAIPPLAIRTRHHSRVMLLCILLGVVCGSLLITDAMTTLPWQGVLPINLIGFFAYSLFVQCCVTIIAQRLVERYALVYAVVSFFSLVVATVASQIGVALDFESSSGFYLIGGVLSGMAALSGAIFLLVAWKVPPKVAFPPSTSEQLNLLVDDNDEEDGNV